MLPYAPPQQARRRATDPLKQCLNTSAPPFSFALIASESSARIECAFLLDYVFIVSTAKVCVTFVSRKDTAFKRRVLVICFLMFV